MHQDMSLRCCTVGPSTCSLLSQSRILLDFHSSIEIVLVAISLMTRAIDDQGQHFNDHRKKDKSMRTLIWRPTYPLLGASVDNVMVHLQNCISSKILCAQLKLYILKMKFNMVFYMFEMDFRMILFMLKMNLFQNKCQNDWKINMNFLLLTVLKL